MVTDTGLGLLLHVTVMNLSAVTALIFLRLMIFLPTLSTEIKKLRINWPLPVHYTLRSVQPLEIKLEPKPLLKDERRRINICMCRFLKSRRRPRRSS